MDQRTDQQAQNHYRNVLAAYMKPGADPKMNDYTERTLSAAKKEMRRRRLPLLPEDLSEPDEFAGYRDLIVEGYPLGDLFCNRTLGEVLSACDRIRKGEKRIEEVADLLLLPITPKLATEYGIHDHEALMRSVFQKVCEYHTI